jgi:hypothetical protein
VEHAATLCHCHLQVGDYAQKTFHLTDRSPTCFAVQFKIFRSTVLNNLIYVLSHPINIQCMYVCVHTRAPVYMPNVSIRISKPSVNYNDHHDQHTAMFHYILYVNIFLLRYFSYFIVYHIHIFYISSLSLFIFSLMCKSWESS